MRIIVCLIFVFFCGQSFAFQTLSVGERIAKIVQHRYLQAGEEIVGDQEGKFITTEWGIEYQSKKLFIKKFDGSDKIIENLKVKITKEELIYYPLWEKYQIILSERLFGEGFFIENGENIFSCIQANTFYFTAHKLSAKNTSGEIKTISHVEVLISQEMLKERFAF